MKHSSSKALPRHALIAAGNWYFCVISADLVMFIQRNLGVLVFFFADLVMFIERILGVLLLFPLNKLYLSGGNL